MNTCFTMKEKSNVLEMKSKIQLFKKKVYLMMTSNA